MFNDTHREKLCFTQFSTTMAAWLLLTFSISSHNQFSSMMFVKNVIHQIGSKNEWLLFTASFTAKFGLIVLTLENAFS